MRFLLKVLNMTMEVVMSGALILSCADILKKDARDMSRIQAVAAIIFIGLTMMFLARTWKWKEVT